MHDITKIHLISSEITGIWNSYMNDSMAKCILKHFLNTVEDVDARPILELALKMTTDHIEELTGFFNREGLPVPVGFSEDKDLNLNAPRLFDDGFYMIYLSFMARVGMERYALILAHTARADVRAYFTKCLNESADLFNKIAHVRLSKGIFIKAPYVVVPKTVQFIEEKSFVNDWYSEKRPFVVREITQLFSSMLSNIVARALATGFGQVCKTDDVIKYIFRGKDITQKRTRLLSSILAKENVPVPSTSDSFVLDSTIAPFSEKLMMFHILLLSSVAISDSGTAMSVILRSDLHATYARFESEILKYASDGTDIMIRNKWLEQPPQAINHENLAMV